MADGGTSKAAQGTIGAPTDSAVGQVRDEAQSHSGLGKNEVAKSEIQVPAKGCGWRDNIGLASDLIGIGGVIVTALTLSAVKKLRRDTLSRVRLPTHIKALQKYASELNTTLGNLKSNANAICATIAQLDSTLAEIVSITTGEPQDKAKDLRERANAFAASELNNSREGWNVYSAINGLIVALENVVANEQVVPNP
ncbi:hypothetical protein [Archangium gephyra]|uniref:hypothetical protein n=1 Tax=Archangium gephyra TaxID=48 RepID=UPI0011C1A8FB|nr:hypothetical protein [Archangium gephyra]